MATIAERFFRAPAAAPARARAAPAGGLFLIFLPADDSGELRWLRGSGERVSSRGAGLGRLPDIGLDRLVAVAPAEAVTLHWAELPGLAPAQARAAARLLVSEASVTPLGDLHVAVGPDDEGEERPVAVVATGRMAGWLARLEAEGLDPDAIVPAALLLPRPEEGHVHAEIGGETVYRGRSSGFADDPSLTPLIVADRPVAALTGAALDAAILAGAEAPALDLRQGPFARRRKLGLDWALVRRLGWITLAILAATLLLQLLLITRLHFAANAVEAQAEARARAALPRGADRGGDSVSGLSAALAAERGGGLGFTTSASIVFGAIQAVPSVELTSLDFAADGTLRAGVRGPGAPEIEALIARIEESGLEASPSTFEASEGRVSGEIRIALP